MCTTSIETGKNAGLLGQGGFGEGRSFVTGTRQDTGETGDFVLDPETKKLKRFDRTARTGGGAPAQTPRAANPQLRIRSRSEGPKRSAKVSGGSVKNRVR